MQGNKLRGPIVACALLGIVCVSSIAYYFYNRRKKRSLLERLKQAYTGDHGFFDNDDFVEQEESYDLPEPSEFSDYLIVQATNQDNQPTATSLDKGSKYDEFEEVAYIEDASDEGRSNKGYKILANKAAARPRPNEPNHTQEADRSNGSSDDSKREASDEWTLIDDYTNVDGSAEQLVYVERTNHVFSEEVDGQKDEPVPLASGQVTVNSDNVDCCHSSCGTDECCPSNPLDNCISDNGAIEQELRTDPIDDAVPEEQAAEISQLPVDESPEQQGDEEMPEVPVDAELPVEPVEESPEQLGEVELPVEPVEEVPVERVDAELPAEGVDAELPVEESPVERVDAELPAEGVEAELPVERVEESPVQLREVEVPVERVEEVPEQIGEVELPVEPVEEVPEVPVNRSILDELINRELVEGLVFEEIPDELLDQLDDEEVPEEAADAEVAQEQVDEEAEAEVLSDNIMEALDDASKPESTKIYFKNFGCSHNISDGEYMLGLLAEHGYKIVDSMENSHLVIINSCTVKGPSEEAMVNMVKSALMSYLPVVVSGCVPQADKNNPVFNNPLVSLLGITQIDRIVEVVENSLQGNKMVLLEKKEMPQLDLPKIRRNELIEIIPLSTGCLGSCTFCKTKHSRGVLGSYDIEVILDRVESCIKEGVKEIWLTSEDLGAYGIDIGTNLVTLLRSIVQVLPRDTMLRLGMSNPPFIKKYIDEICDILLHDNVYEFIHIPVQSFSNSVLSKMNREYKVEEFLQLVETIRTKVPNCTIATDVIAGFPTEKHEDHLKTVSKLQELELPVVNISQYYPRQGTIASKMKQLPGRLRRNRTREITDVFMSYEKNSKYMGKVIKVYFNQINDQHQLVGHDKHYVKVMLASQLKHKDTVLSNTNQKKTQSNGYINNALNNGNSNGIIYDVVDGVIGEISPMTISRSSSGSIYSAGRANSCNCTCEKCTDKAARGTNGNTSVNLNGNKVGNGSSATISNCNRNGKANNVKGNNVVTNAKGNKGTVNTINGTNGISNGNNTNGNTVNGNSAINKAKVTNGKGKTNTVNGTNGIRNGNSINGADGSPNDLGTSDNDIRDGCLSDAQLESTPNTSSSGDDSTTDTRDLTDKYFGTVQYVKVVRTTKWHLECIIV